MGCKRAKEEAVTVQFGSFSRQRKFCRNRVSPALCHDRVSCVTTGFPVSRQAPQTIYMTRPGHAQRDPLEITAQRV